MKRILILLLVAVFTIVILLLVYNPDPIEKIWLWIVGLIGSIVALLQQGWNWIKRQFETIQNKTTRTNTDRKTHPALKDNPDKMVTSNNETPMITLLRVSNDGDSTLGMLYYDEIFCCYTIEDYPSENDLVCRVPAGIYHIGFSENAALNKEYSSRIRNFQRHLQLTDAPPNYDTILHFGGIGATLKGDIILTDITEIGRGTQMFQQSKIIFENFYNLVSDQINKGEFMIIKIFDETWFKEKIN